MIVFTDVSSLTETKVKPAARWHDECKLTLARETGDFRDDHYDPESLALPAGPDDALDDRTRDLVLHHTVLLGVRDAVSRQSGRSWDAFC